MSLSKPFPLLRLPRLPLFKVLNGIGVQERFYISICSSKAKYAIKFYNDRLKFSVTFHFKKTFAFSLKTMHREHLIDVRPIFGATWTVLSSVEASSGNWFEKKVKRLLLVLVDVFNIPAICLVFEERRHEIVTGFINYIQSIKLKVHSLKIKSKNGEDMEFVLDTCREGFSEIHLDCPMTPGFEYENMPLTPKFSVDKLTIKNAEWVTTWHLTTFFINCKHLILDECREGSLVKQFIYEWIYGCSQLKYARLTFGHDQTRMRLVESDWLGTRLPRVDRCYGSKYLADIMKTIPSTILPTKEMGWEFGLLDTKVYRIRQQKTGREAHVFSNCRAIGITDSRLAYPNYP